MSWSASDRPRRLAVEALGTGLLVATVVGSGIMATRLTGDLGLQLLANTLPTGAILIVLITVLGPLSGAHFNPAVSMVSAWRGDLTGVDAVLYGLAQISGGVAGTMLAHAMFDLPLLVSGVKNRSGLSQWLSEAVATFGLLTTILGAVRFAPDRTAVLVGLYIVAAYWFTASTSFANPAVSLARSLTDTFSGIAPMDVPAFVVAQIVGAALAAWLLGWLSAQRDAQGPESAEGTDRP